MKFLKGVLYVWSYLLLSATCDGAVSSPDDKEACVGEDVNIPWRYDDNDADIASVIWSVNTSTDIMTYFGSTRDPQAGFNVISANNEGSITLTSVTRSNTGTYKISVTALQTSSDEVDVLVCDPASSAGLKGTKSDSIITCEASDLGDPEADLFIKVGGKAKTSPSAEVTIFDKVECCLSGCSVKCMTGTSEQYCIIAQNTTTTTTTTTTHPPPTISNTYISSSTEKPSTTEKVTTTTAGYPSRNIIIGASVGGTFILIVIISTIVCCQLKKRNQEKKSDKSDTRMRGGNNSVHSKTMSEAYENNAYKL